MEETAEKDLFLDPNNKNALIDRVRNIPSLPDQVGWVDVIKTRQFLKLPGIMPDILQKITPCRMRCNNLQCYLMVLFTTSTHVYELILKDLYLW